MQPTCQPPLEFVHPLRSQECTCNTAFLQPKRTVRFLTPQRRLSPFLVPTAATHSDMVGKSNERWHCPGRDDRDGEHLSIKPVVIGIENGKVEDVRHRLTAGLKRGGVAVKVRTRSGSGGPTDSQANTPHPCR